LAIKRPNGKYDYTYGNYLLATLKYDRIDIQSKVFDSAICIPTLYSLLKNYASNSRSGSEPDLAIQRPNGKDDYTYGN
jgi:hypothetical protein